MRRQPIHVYCSRRCKDRARRRGNAKQIPIVVALLCVNCDKSFESTPFRLLFCSDLCRQIAHYVRYARRVGKEERWKDDPDVATALVVRKALILGGGYDRRARRLPSETRAQVIERDGGRCRNCGEAGSTVDHIADSSAELTNLQLLCVRCHNAKTMAGMKLLTDPAVRALSREIDRRVISRRPLRPCDDDVRWWPVGYWELTAERRKVRAAAGSTLTSE